MDEDVETQSHQENPFSSHSKRNLQVTQPTCQSTYKYFPMIFGMDQSTTSGNGCLQSVELTGMMQDPVTVQILIAGHVASSTNCANLGITGTIRRSFLLLTDYRGVAQWIRFGDNAGGPTDAIMAPMFFQFVEPGPVTVNYIFAILTKVNQFIQMATTTPYAITTPYTFGPTFQVVKVDPSTGNTLAQVQYTPTGSPVTVVFTEFRMVSDIANTTNDGIYIVSSVMTNPSGDWSSTNYQAMLLKISTTTMSVIQFAYFALAVDNLAQDIVMGQSGGFLYMLGREYQTPKYTPYVAKLNLLDMSVSASMYSTIAAQQTTLQTPYYARIAVCETLGFFFYAHNNAGTQTGFYLTSGVTSTMTPTNGAQFAAGTTTAITVFDMYYHCVSPAASSHLALVYASGQIIYFVRFTNPYASATGTQTLIPSRSFNRGVSTIPINSIYTSFSKYATPSTMGIIAWASANYLSTAPTWPNRIIMHQYDYFLTAAWDFHTYSCMDPINILATDTTTSTVWSAVTSAAFALTTTAQASPPAISGTYMMVANTNPNILPATMIETFYMMNDKPYTYTIPLCTATTCPTYTVSCNPTFDWSPKQYTYNVDTNTSPTLFNVPTAMDCLGRSLSTNDPTNYFRFPGGASLSTNDANVFSYSASTGEFSVTLTNTNLNYIGSRGFTFMGFISSQFNVNLYIRFNIVRSSTNVRNPAAINNAATCTSDKIYPFLFGYSGYDVNVTYTNMDAYGNLMFAGWGSKAPYGWQNTTMQGFIASVDQYGNPYWVYMLKDDFFIMTNNVCTYIRHQVLSGSDYVFAMCNAWRLDLQYTTPQYTNSPVLFKLKYATGETVWMRYLPVDSFGNVNNQNGLFVEQSIVGGLTDKIYAIFRYRYSGPTAIQTFAGVHFSETTFATDAFTIFNSPDPTAGGLGASATPRLGGWFSTYVLSDQTNLYTVVYADGALGVFLYSMTVAMTGIKSGKIALTTGTSAPVDIQPCLYGASNMLIPILNNVYPAAETLYVVQVARSTLISINQVAITFTTTTQLTNAGIVADSSGNIYVYASYTQMVFYKFSSTFALLQSKIQKTTGTGNSMLGKGIMSYGTSNLFVVFGGYWATPSATVKQSISILRANTNFDFSGYTCGLMIENFNSWETNYYPGAQVVTASTTIVTSIAALVGVAGSNYYYSIYPLMPEAYSISLWTYSFDNTSPNYGSVGASQVPGFYKYPMVGVQCYLYEVLNSYQNIDGSGNVITIYEYTLNMSPAQQVITPVVPSVTNCQGRAQSMRVLDIRSPSSTVTTFPWLTYTSTQITVDTSMLTNPESAQLTVRYFDTLATEAMGYYDFDIQIRVVASANITASTQTYPNLQTCSQNIYPMSYGGQDTSHSPNAGNNMISYGFYFVTDDNNIIISGKTQNLTHDDGATNDGFIMRTSPLGFINWLSYISTRQLQDEYVGNAVYQNGLARFVYGHFHSNHVTQTSRTSAIVKLTYEEGKLVWSRTIMFVDSIYTPPSTIIRDSGYMIDPDPTNPNNLLVSSYLLFSGVGYIPAITVLQDTGTQLNVVYNYYIKLQQASQTTATAQVSGMSFADNPSSGAFFGVSAYIDATNNYRAAMYARIDQTLGTINWATYVPGTAALPIETMNQPHVVQHKSKLFTAVTINTATVGQIGCVYLSAFNIANGFQTANKLVVMDSANQLSNAQLVPDLSNSATSGFNVFLVVTLKNGYYMAIQQLDDSFTINANQQRFHPTTSSPFFLDSLMYNHKSLVYPTSDSYYLLANFDRFFQTSNVESVVFKQDYNILLSGMYTCHQWTYIPSTMTLVNTYPATLMTATQTSNVFYIWNNLVTLDNMYVRLYQQQNYPAYYYPQNEVYPGHNYDELLPSMTCSTMQPNQLLDLPIVTMNIGDIKTTITVDNTVLLQCQGMPTNFSFVYMDSGTTSITPGIDDFITLDNVNIQVTIDSSGFAITPPLILPSYRAVRMQSCNTVYTSQCSYHDMSVNIFSPSQAVSTMTYQTRAVSCLAKSEWPKVLSDNDLNSNAFISMSIDQTQGNMLICGWSLLNSQQAQAYTPANGKKTAVIFLLNNLGDVQWHYSFRSIMSPTQGDLAAQGCMFSADEATILSLVYNVLTLTLSLMSQGYDKGEVNFIRTIPGTFSNIDGGYTLTQNYAASPNLINQIFIAGRQTVGTGSSNAWHLQKIDISGTVPKQNWHSYLTTVAAAQNYQGIDQLGISNNLIAAASIYASTTRHHALVQIDIPSGSYTSYFLQVTANCKASGTTVITTFKSQGFVIDTVASGNMYYAYLDQSNPSNDILHYASINPITFAVNYEFMITLPLVATAPWLSVSVDNTGTATGYAYVLIANNLQNNEVLRFAKTSGVIQSFSYLAGATTSVHSQARLKFFNTDQQLYVMYSATYYVTSAQAGVIHKINYDLTNPLNCIGLTAQTIPVKSVSSTIANYVSPPTATLVGTYVNLFPTEKIYAEIINFALPLGFGFRSAQNLQCSPPPPAFLAALPNIQILVANTGVATTVTYTVPGAAQCAGVTLLGTWSVDRDTDANSQPPWITMTAPLTYPFTGTGGTLTLSPTNAQIGQYAVRITYYSPVNSGTVTETFIVDVYPIVDLTFPTPSTTCVPNIYPLTLGNYQNINVFDGDTDGTNIMVCGSTTSTKNAIHTTYESAFMQIYNKNIMPNYQLTLEMGVAQSQMAACRFGNTGFLYFGINSRATSGSANFDKIYMYKYYQSSAKFSNGMMFSAPGQLAQLMGMIVEPVSGDQFYAGQVQASAILVNAGQIESFVLKLNTNMQYQYMRTFQGYTSSYAKTLVTDATTGVYTHMQQLVSVGLYAMRIVKLSYGGSGAPIWGTYVYQATQMMNPKGMGGLSFDPSNLYSCMSIANLAGTVTQTILMKYTSATGTLVSDVQMYTPSAIDCNVIYHTSSSKVLLSISYSTGVSDLVSFVASTLSMDTLSAKLQFVTTGYTQSAGSRMTFMSNDVWIFYPSVATLNSYQSLFVTRINDVLGMNWESALGCTSVHQRFINSGVFTAYDVGSPLYGGDSIDQTSSIVFTAAGSILNIEPLQSLVSVYLMSPDQVAVYSNSGASKPAIDLKFSYSVACSVWAAPTTSVLTSEIGASGYSVGANNYTLVQPPFVVAHCQGLTFTYSATMGDTTPLLSWIYFAPLTITYNFAPASNTLVGTYTISLIGTITANPLYQILATFSTASFNILLIDNQAPLMDTTTFTSTYSIYSHHNWNVTAMFLSDNEGDDPYISAQFVTDLVSLTPVVAPSWLVTDNSTQKQIFLKFNNPPQPTGVALSQTWYIQISIWDNYNILTPNFYYITFTIARNYPPYMIPASFPLVIPTIQVPYSFTTIFHYSNFHDAEGDTIIIDCTNRVYNTSIPATWTSCNQNATAGTITLSGTIPASNTWAGNYVFTIKVQDQYLDGNYTQDQLTLVVTPKPNIVITGGPANAVTRLPNATWVCTATYSSDINSLSYRKILYINNTIWSNGVFGKWMVWDEAAQNVTVTPISNTEAGTHQMGVMLNDLINTPQWINFTIQVIPDYPLVALTTLPNLQAIVNNWFYFDFNKTLIFHNPQADQATNITMYLASKDTTPPSLPYFMYQYPNGTLYGYGGYNDIATYSLQCVGVGEAGWLTTIDFQITVQPCYYKCSGCWNTDYNTCLTCNKGYYLLAAECNDVCPQGYYQDNVLNECFICPSTCTICAGPDPTQNCSVCVSGNYQLGQGCYVTCPAGYWGDNSDFNCKPCNPACTICTGPLSTQCNQCGNLLQKNPIGIVQKAGYLLIGTSCQVPKCSDGQFFIWNTVPDDSGNIVGSCVNCDPTCKACTGPNSAQCYQCHPDRQLIPSIHECWTCPEINIGLFLNEQYQCEDICGDGIIVNKPCDDGNTISGDGCSSTCQIEYGWICPVANQTCKNVVPPTFSIVSMSPTNQHFVKFSVGVYLDSIDTISASNMNINIVGEKGLHYVFQWRIIPDQHNELIPDNLISKFSIKLYNIQSNLDGTENIKITFNDYSQISDANGNLLVNNSYAAHNVAPFVYTSAGEASTVGAGGATMKFAFISAVGFQLGLKIVVGGSMQYLWGLVHALQVFQKMLLMNINFPPQLPAFVAFFSIASGDPNGIGAGAYIPNAVDILVNENDIPGQYDEEILPPKFAEEGISPYFIITFKGQLNTWIPAFFFAFPALLILTKICKKITFFQNFLGGFMFNGPLRTVEEMYFEMVITVILNTNFIKFKNRSQFIASLVAFIFGSFALLLPFILMNIVYAHRRQVRKRKFRASFGMLTDEFSQKSIAQLYHYSVYLFQRLTFAAALVFMYSYPLIQLAIVMAANLLMIFFLISVIPYKEENQQTSIVIDEIILFIVMCLFVYIYLTENTMSPDQLKTMGWVIMFIMIISIVKNLFVVLYFGFLSMRGKMKSMFAAEDEHVDSPHTSDNNSDTIDSIDTEEIEDDIQREEYDRDEYNSRIKQRQEERKQPQVIEEHIEYGPYGGSPTSMQRQDRHQVNPMNISQSSFIPGQMAYNDYYDEQPFQNVPQAPVQSFVAKQPVVPLRNNNFFERNVTANDQLDELEQVANEPEYGYEYDQEGYGQEGYGQEYGQEGFEQQPPDVYDFNDNREDWGDNLNKPTKDANQTGLNQQNQPVVNFDDAEEVDLGQVEDQPNGNVKEPEAFEGEEFDEFQNQE